MKPDIILINNSLQVDILMTASGRIISQSCRLKFHRKAHNALLKSQRNDEPVHENIKKVKKSRQRLSDGIQNKERMIVVTGSREDLSVLSGFSNNHKL